MQMFPTLFNKNRTITKDQLNDNFIHSILFNIQKYHTKFITPCQYYGVSLPAIYTITSELQNGVIQFDSDKNYYTLTYTDQTITFGEILEVYNITRNETYKVIHSEQNVITFLQDYSTEDIIDEIESSSIRIIQNSSKQDLIESEIQFDISSTFEPQNDSYLYILLYIGSNTFQVYSISLPEISYYLQENNVTISELLVLMQDDSFIYTLYSGIYQWGDVVFDSSNIQTVQDLTIEVNDRTKLAYLDQTEYEKDIFYFYVNRNETISILIEDQINTSEAITVEQLENILQYSYMNYIFGEKVKIEGQLPITLTELKNVTISGFGHQSSEINFSEQTYTGVTNFFDIVDCTDIQFKNLTFQLYDPTVGETIPTQGQGYVEQSEYTLIKINQSSIDPMEILNDNIYVKDSILNRIEHIFEQGTNIVDSNYPKTDIENVQYIPRGIDLVQSVVDNLLEFGIIDPEIIPSYTLKIGDGSTTKILWEPLSNLNFTSSNSNLIIDFTDATNTINFTIDGVQFEGHTHAMSDLTSGILGIQQGGTNNDTFEEDTFIYYDGSKLRSGVSLEDALIQQLQGINIDIKDNSTTQFSLTYDDQITFQSQNTDLIISFDEIDHKIIFTANVPVTSVNTKTGNVVLTQQDIGQQQITHNHDDLYLKLTGGTIRPTVDGEQLTVENQQGSEVFSINTDTNGMYLYQGVNPVLTVDDDEFTYKSFTISMFDSDTIVFSEQQGGVI